MAAKGYCTSADVEAFLGITFTAGQTAQCNSLIEQVEITIDGETNRAWLTGAQTDEAVFYPGYEVFLRYAPVASVESITGRAGLGNDEEALTVDEDYEVRDLDGGLVYVVRPGNYDRLLIDYTPVATVPADIKKACIEWVAVGLQPQLQPGSFGLDSYSLPDLTVRFSRSHVQAAMPPGVQQVIDRYRFRVHA